MVLGFRISKFGFRVYDSKFMFLGFRILFLVILFPNFIILIKMFQKFSEISILSKISKFSSKISKILVKNFKICQKFQNSRQKFQICQKFQPNFVKNFKILVQPQIAWCIAHRPEFPSLGGKLASGLPRKHKIPMSKIVSAYLVEKVLRIFFKILVMRANFGFWYRDNFVKFGLVTRVTPILGQIFQNFDHRILVKSPSYDKPPWRNFDFWSNFDEIENLNFDKNRKFEILNPSRNPNLDL